MTDANRVTFKSASRLVLILFLFVLWIGFLLSETVLTANPVIVSRPQIINAPLIAEGRPNWTEMLFEVGGVLKGELPGNSKIHVENLQLAEKGGEGDRFVLPLMSTDSGSYRIVAVPTEEWTSPNAAVYLVYPASEEVRSQIAAILTGNDRSPR